MSEDVIDEFFGGSVTPADHRCGTVAIVGRPNVGKSTLLNHLIGQKLSITSRKPQTTRHRILGILTREHYQILFVDTPGMHQEQKKAINRVMNRSARSALRDVDLVFWVVDAKRHSEEDDWVLERLQEVSCPVILVLNKVDQLDDKEQLLPRIAELSALRAFQEIVPVSALTGHNLERLETLLPSFLPLRPPLFPADQITDRSQRFLAAEVLREKVMRQLGDEVPYELTVEIEQFSEEGRLLRIQALILVEREGQKAIVIGEGGQRLKRIGSEARLDMEKLFAKKIMLSLWVKIKGGWSDDERALRSLGYGDEA